MIYAITFPDSAKRYVGSAKAIGPRMRAHLSLLRKGKHHSIHLQRAFNRRLGEGLSVVILEDDVQNDQLVEREQVWLDRHKGKLYNISPTASSRLGATMSKSARQKISASLAGNSYRAGSRHDPETKAKIGRGVALSYSEGRKRKLYHPENLAEYNNAHRKIPSHEAAFEALKELKNYAAVGRKFGVTPNAVRDALRRLDPEILKQKWKHK